MAADYTFDAGLVFNPETTQIIRDATGALYEDTTASSPVAMYDLLGGPITELVSNEIGLLPPFKADIPFGYVKFGTLFQPVISYEAQLAGTQATASRIAAETAATAAAASAQSAAGAQTTVLQLQETMQTDLAGVVRFVNDTAPDVNGNVDVVVTGPGGGTGTVTSVASVDPDTTGDVPLASLKAALDLELVQNIAPADMPVSTAMQTALDAKAADAAISEANIINITSTTRGLITGQRFWKAFIWFLIQSGQYYTVIYTGTAWPAISTVPADYIATGRAIVWDSQNYPGIAEPPESRNGIDFWIRNES